MKDKCINRCGFTLIELILVLAILAIIAAIAVPRYVGMQDKAKERVLKTNCSYLYTMLAIYEMDYDEEHRFKKSGKGSADDWLSIYIEEYLQDVENDNCERYRNPYNEAKGIYNWDNMNAIGYKDYNSASVFITNDSHAKYSGFSISHLSEEDQNMFEGVIIVYIDTENNGRQIDIYYIHKDSNTGKLIKSEHLKTLN